MARLTQAEQAAELLGRSLVTRGGRHLAVVLAAIFAVLALPLGAMALLGTRSPAAGWVALGAALAMPMVVFAVAEALRSADERENRAWLARLGLGLDVRSYLALLSVPARERALVVTVVFAGPIAERDRAGLEAAVHRAAPRATLAWLGQGARLQVTSPTFATTVRLHRGGTVVTNQRLHGFLRALLDGALPALQAARPISRLKVKAG